MFSSLTPKNIWCFQGVHKGNTEAIWAKNLVRISFDGVYCNSAIPKIKIHQDLCDCLLSTVKDKSSLCCDCSGEVIPCTPWFKLTDYNLITWLTFAIRFPYCIDPYSACTTSWCISNFRNSFRCLSSKRFFWHCVSVNFIMYLVPCSLNCWSFSNQLLQIYLSALVIKHFQF